MHRKIFIFFPILCLYLSCSTYPPFKSVENYFCMASFNTYDESKRIINSYESCEGQLIRGDDKYIYNFKVAKVSDKMEILGSSNLRLQVKYKDKPDYTSAYPSRALYGDLLLDGQKFNLTWENSWITIRDDNILGREINIIIEKDIRSENTPNIILKSGPSLLMANNIEYEKIKNKDLEPFLRNKYP